MMVLRTAMIAVVFACAGFSSPTVVHAQVGSAYWGGGGSPQDASLTDVGAVVQTATTSGPIELDSAGTTFVTDDSSTGANVFVYNPTSDEWENTATLTNSDASAASNSKVVSISGDGLTIALADEGKDQACTDAAGDPGSSTGRTTVWKYNSATSQWEQRGERCKKIAAPLCLS